MLIHRDLASWRAWQARQRGPVRRARAAVASRRPGPLRLRTWAGTRGRSILVALDYLAPSEDAAVLAPATALRDRGYGVVLVTPRAVSPGDWGAPASDTLVTVDDHVGPLADVAAALSIGDHLPAGAWVREHTCRHRLPLLVAQHGVLTPWAPPPPPGSLVLAWSDCDGEFWTGGRPDVGSRTVGSHLLWSAARQVDPQRAASTTGSWEPGVTFLGQLHGAELPRAATVATVEELRRQGPVRYRPHPAEQDRLSRRQHRRWEARGIRLVPPGPLELTQPPVVSHFSTGILEAAALGLPAYAACTDPPYWLEALWERYGMSRWGSEAPTRVQVPAGAPAEVVADVVEESLP